MRNSLEAFHKSVKPSQWRFFNRYMVPFITYPVHFIGIFHWIPSSFHCGFSLDTQCLSLQFFKCISGYFIAIFHWIPSAFHCHFSNISLGISLQFSIRYPVHFIAVFHMYPWVFHCDFSTDTHSISLRNFPM